MARRRLTPLALDAKRQEEIIVELADHLEDLYSDLVRQGKSEVEALQSALTTAADWDELRCEIQLAASEEVSMNYRVKTLWLPGACTIVLSGVILRLLQIPSAPAPHVFWVWQGMSLVLYWRWLLCLPLVGALGAYWSRRAGGKLLDRLLAASLYPLGLTCALALTFIIGLVLPLDSRVPLSIKLVALGAYTVGWGIAPFIPLLLGALPFLRGDAGESRPVAASH
jgi:hypothetical protein